MFGISVRIPGTTPAPVPDSSSTPASVEASIAAPGSPVRFDAVTFATFPAVDGFRLLLALAGFGQADHTGIPA